MAPTNRRRAPAASANGRAMRRTRTGADSDDSVSSSFGPLPPIGEDVELAKALSVTSTGTHFSESPDRQLSRKKTGVRAREDSEDEIEKKKRRALTLLEEIEAEGAFYEGSRAVETIFFNLVVSCVLMPVEKRCEDLMAEAEHKAKDLHMELKVQLMFLPEAVRKMPWKTFIEDFGGSLENVIQNVKDQDYRNYVAASPLKVSHLLPRLALMLEINVLTHLLHVVCRQSGSFQSTCNRGMRLICNECVYFRCMLIHLSCY